MLQLCFQFQQYLYAAVLFFNLTYIKENVFHATINSFEAIRYFDWLVHYLII